jgi:hypothetical protein
MSFSITLIGFGLALGCRISGSFGSKGREPVGDYPHTPPLRRGLYSPRVYNAGEQPFN